MADGPDLALPHAIALTWGVAESPQRGPKREMSLERIVDAAIEIADAEGLSAVSMARVASSLGYTTMSLYRYVTSKDDLLMLMQDAAADVETPPERERADWRDELREWALMSLGVLRAHPWMLDIPISGPPMTPNNLRMADAGVRAMRATRLDAPEKLAVILLVSSYTRSAGIIERDIARSGYADVPPEAAAALTAALSSLVTPERFPHLHPIVASGVYSGQDDFDDVAFGLERLLDGIQVYLDSPEVSGRPAGQTRAAVRHDDALAGTYLAARDAVDGRVTDKDVREAGKARREAEKKVREAQKHLREALKRERDAERELLRRMREERRAT